MGEGRVFVRNVRREIRQFGLAFSEKVWYNGKISGKIKTISSMEAYNFVEVMRLIFVKEK
jgi:hypothetical protein